MNCSVCPSPIGLGLKLRNATGETEMVGVMPAPNSPITPEVAPCIGLPGIRPEDEALAVCIINVADTRHSRSHH